MNKKMGWRGGFLHHTPLPKKMKSHGALYLFVFPISLSVSKASYLSGASGTYPMVPLDAGTVIYSVVITIIVISFLYAIIRWWRWFQH